jgi:hypothetical protein
MSSFGMNIRNLFNRGCSFCGNGDHDVRQCNSTLIKDIDRRLSEGFYAISQQCGLLRMNEDATKVRFINWAADMFQLKELKVLAVITIGAAASGRNKNEYALDVWNIYKLLTTRVLTSIDMNTIVSGFSTVAGALNNGNGNGNGNGNENENENGNENENENENGNENENENVNENVNNNVENDSISSLVEDEITWSIDRTPTRHSDVEMMGLPRIRSIRGERERQRRIPNYIPNQEFMNYVRNLMNDFDNTDNDNDDNNNKYNINAIMAEEESECDHECCICLNDTIERDNIVKLNCQHQFCADCIITTLKKYNNTIEPRCALCRDTMTTIEVNHVGVLEQLNQFCNK